VSIWQDSEDEVAWILSQPDDPKETAAAIKSYIDDIHRDLDEILVMKTYIDMMVADVARRKDPLAIARANLAETLRNLHK